MSKEKFKYTKEFLEKVKNGDNDATTLLYEDAKDIAYNKAYSILNNHHDAEDIAEDSVLRAIEKIDTIKKPSEFPAWIRRIAENKAKDYIKKDKPTYMGEDFEYTTNDLNSDQKVLPEKMADSQENIDLYKKLIAKLTDDQRNALVLNRIEGYKTREIAEMLGCSENTIKSRIHQGEKKLVKEAENLKKKGYTLNGMMPLDFFTFMSKSLGVTSTNVASVVGATVLKSLSLKIVAGVVAVVVVVSGVVGVSYLYTKSDVTQNGYVSNVQMYQIIDKDETNYIKTLLAYISSSDKGDSSDYSKMTDSEILDVLNSYYMVTNNLKGAKDLFPSAQTTTDTGMPKRVVPQKDVQKVAKEVFGKTLSSSASSDDVELIDSNYYFAVPMGGKEYTLDIKNVEYNKNRSKVTVTYTFNSGYYGVDTTEHTATFTRNGNNKNFPFRIVSQNKDREITTTTTNPTKPTKKVATNATAPKTNFTKYKNLKYDGKVVDFGDYTLKVPNSWKYEINEDGQPVFYETKTKKQGGGAHLIKIYVLDSWNENIAHTGAALLGSKNGKYFVAQGYMSVEAYMEDGQRVSKKWEDIFNSAYNLIDSVLATFKLKNKR